MLERSPSRQAAAKARQAAYRARKRRRAIVARVEVGEALVGLLVASRYLAERDSRDLAAIEAALAAMLRDARVWSS
jgi:hypothetical protein